MAAVKTAMVGATTFTTPSDREIAATRAFNAPRKLIFDAYTKPEHVPHWMLGPDGWSMPVCEIDLRRGGGWHFVWRQLDGTEMEMRGVYKEITPPERLVSTESWGRRLARNAQHGGPHRGRRQDEDGGNGSLPVEGGSRKGAGDGDEGRLVPELRSSRRVPANDRVSW
jgi:uncharacterized protein YndB with AHSA1/START domain